MTELKAMDEEVAVILHRMQGLHAGLASRGYHEAANTPFDPIVVKVEQAIGILLAVRDALTVEMIRARVAERRERTLASRSGQPLPAPPRTHTAVRGALGVARACAPAR